MNAASYTIKLVERQIDNTKLLLHKLETKKRKIDSLSHVIHIITANILPFFNRVPSTSKCQALMANLSLNTSLLVPIIPFNPS